MVKEWTDAQALRVTPYEKHAVQGEVVIGFSDQSQNLKYQIIAHKPELILARPEIGMQFTVASEQADRLLSVKTKKQNSTVPKKK